MQPVLPHRAFRVAGDRRKLVRSRLCKLLVCLGLVFGSLTGAYMRPDEIEELMRTMNQPVVETTIPDESDKDDPLKKELREQGIQFD
jgi:hypothetical protein